ncbi:hypothetical protein OCC_11257 [Thermococcus litoralis DSM 5473]|uniref:Uncharacterized protein n=1 Tax=Thermococcus litoralis (strain ATCC 51850 / DSM 5473 / JCM 8560 / NS-C) TaxID=523849 RepID=H3ZN92_THELN|nr:hypothetical protein [Thermococcus litoralis]EHR78516.1 hypothetical protein OCC_11257 [Thermococcus litoralis DSM 5473]
MKKDLLALLIFIPLVSAGNVNITPYGDGYATVEIEVPVDDYATQVTLSLIGDHYEDVFVTDENDNPLEYYLNGNEITVNAQDAQIVKITYTTPDLIKQEGLVWTISLRSDNPVSVILPEGASLVDMSDVPLEVEGNKITLLAGEIEVSFTLEEGTDTPNLAKEKSAPTKIILSLGVLLLISILGFALWKR